jgi:hypothetical protein
MLTSNLLDKKIAAGQKRLECSLLIRCLRSLGEGR